MTTHRVIHTLCLPGRDGTAARRAGASQPWHSTILRPAGQTSRMHIACGRCFRYAFVNGTPACCYALFCLNDLLHFDVVSGSIGSRICESAKNPVSWHFFDGFISIFPDSVSTDGHSTLINSGYAVNWKGTCAMRSHRCEIVENRVNNRHRRSLLARYTLRSNPSGSRNSRHQTLGRFSMQRFHRNIAC